MKKILAVAAAMATLATAAFAEITVGSWARSIFVPVMNDGDETYTFKVQSWGGEPRYAGLGIHGTSDNLGFNVDLHYNGNGPSGGDNAHMWFKPFANDVLTFTLGKYDNNAIRGDLCYGSWDWIRPGFYNDEGLTFSAQKANGDEGAWLESRPVEGLYLFATVPVRTSKPGNTSEDTFKKTQFGGAYTIDGIGTIKAQFITKGIKDDDKGAPVNKDGKAKDYAGNVEVAFDLKAVEGLYVTIGAKIPVTDAVATIDAKGEPNYLDKTVAAGVSYNLGDVAPLTIFASTSIGINDAYKSPKVAFGVGANYGLDNGFAIDADFRMKMETKADVKPETVVEDEGMEFMIGLSKGFSNGKVGIGFQGYTNGQGPLGHKDDFAFAIPVVLQMNF